MLLQQLLLLVLLLFVLLLLKDFCLTCVAIAAANVVNRYAGVKFVKISLTLKVVLLKDDEDAVDDEYFFAIFKFSLVSNATGVSGIEVEDNGDDDDDVSKNFKEFLVFKFVKATFVCVKVVAVCVADGSANILVVSDVSAAAKSCCVFDVNISDICLAFVAVAAATSLVAVSIMLLAFSNIFPRFFPFVRNLIQLCLFCYQRYLFYKATQNVCAFNSFVVFFQLFLFFKQTACLSVIQLVFLFD